jgi:hypothetical protein
MKILFTTLLLLALLSRIVNTCDVDMPNIMLSVQFTGRAALGSQQSTELVIPLYSNCNYEHQADPVQANGTFVAQMNSKYFNNKFIKAVQHQTRQSPQIFRQILLASSDWINYHSIPKPLIAFYKP